jgi:hypothetical protein
MGGGEVQKFRDPGPDSTTQGLFLANWLDFWALTRKARSNQGLTRALPGNGRQGNLRGKICADARERRDGPSWRQSH